MGSDLFAAAADVTISYAAESDSESTASVSVVDGTIAVMPTSEGRAHVTVTTTAGSDAVERPRSSSRQRRTWPAFSFRSR